MTRFSVDNFGLKRDAIIYRVQKNNDENAFVQLGNSKKLISSIRFWLKDFNIIENKGLVTECEK